MQAMGHPGFRGAVPRLYCVLLPPNHIWAVYLLDFVKKDDIALLFMGSDVEITASLDTYAHTAIFIRHSAELIPASVAGEAVEPII